MYFKVIKSGANRKLMYDFLLVVYSNFCRISIWVALQVFEQFCPKAGDAKPLVAEPETDFNAE